MRAALLALVLLTACQAGGTGEHVIEINPADHLPEGYPPRIGGVAGVLNGQAMAWDTYDYSIGAFDSAVQITDFNGETRFALRGVPVGQPNARVNRVDLVAAMTGPGQTGALSGAVVEVLSDQWDGPRLSSSGSEAQVVLDTLVVDEGGYGGRVTGHFSATVCAADGFPAVVDTTKCQTISGTFDSGLQISGS